MRQFRRYFSSLSLSISLVYENYYTFSVSLCITARVALTYLVDILGMGGPAPAAGASADLPLNTLCRVWLLLLLLLQLGLLLLLLLLKLLLLLLQLDRSDRLLLRTGEVTRLYAHIARHHAWTGAAVW